MEYLIYKMPPKDFHPKIEAAGCYIEVGDKILFLRRHTEKPQGRTWGVPGGKLEKEETPRSAVIREVMEEVGVDVGEGLLEISSLYIRLKALDYIFHRFRKEFLAFPKLVLNLEEHDEARWVTPEEALKLPLIAAGKEALLDYLEEKLSFLKSQSQKEGE